MDCCSLESPEELYLYQRTLEEESRLEGDVYSKIKVSGHEVSSIPSVFKMCEILDALTFPSEKRIFIRDNESCSLMSLLMMFNLT